MAASNGPSFFWDKFIPFVYGLGAAVVIIGAMGKIMHYDWAGIALPLGLGTEAVIFLIYAFQAFLRPSVEYQWEKVYPELSENFDGPAPVRAAAVSNVGLTSKIDDALASSGMNSDVLEKLKGSFSKLTDTVSKLGDISDASVATSEYAANVKSASTKIGELNSAYGVAVNAINSLSGVTKDAQEYREQFNKITQNMGALNAVYELELQDTNKHLKAMNAFYGNLSSAMSDMTEASKETQHFKQELSKLTNNLNSLNSVYGSMLSAMKGS
jgi:gliding motility-associated protein GldL